MIGVEGLRPLPVFDGVDDLMLTRIANVAAEVPLAAGEYAIHEGEVPAFYVVIEGCLEVTKRVGSVERVLDTRDQAGDYFGEIPLLMGSLTFANLRAVSEARVLRLNPEDFRWLVRASPPFASRVLETMSRRVVGVQELAAEQPPATATVVGRRYDPACHDLRDFLARNHVSFEYYDIDDPAAERLVPGLVAHRDACPLVQMYAGELLVQPDTRRVAEALGLPTQPSTCDYDVAVVGGGPAGLAAAVYGASEGLRTLLLEREAPGGQAGTSSRIENYLGFPTGLSGDDLAERALNQAKRFGAEVVVTRRVTALEPGDDEHVVRLDGDDSVRVRAVVLATGVTWRRLTLPGFDRFFGAGVYYGAARAEAIGMRGKRIHLIGAGNSAGQAAMFFSLYAERVTMLVRGAALEAAMSDYLVRQVRARPNIEVELRSEVTAAYGDGHVSEIDVVNRVTGETTRRTTDGVFVFIGADAETEWLPKAIARDSRGYVLTGARMQDREHDAPPWPCLRAPFFLETSVPGIFAAGDVRAYSIKRVAAGVGEGSMAIAFIHQFLEDARAAAAPSAVGSSPSTKSEPGTPAASVS